MQEDTNTEPVENEEPNRWESAGKVEENFFTKRGGFLKDEYLREYRDTL